MLTFESVEWLHRAIYSHRVHLHGHCRREARASDCLSMNYHEQHEQVMARLCGSGKARLSDPCQHSLALFNLMTLVPV